MHYHAPYIEFLLVHKRDTASPRAPLFVLLCSFSRGPLLALSKWSGNSQSQSLLQDRKGFIPRPPKKQRSMFRHPRSPLMHPFPMKSTPLLAKSSSNSILFSSFLSS